MTTDIQRKPPTSQSNNSGSQDDEDGLKSLDAQATKILQDRQNFSVFTRFAAIIVSSAAVMKLMIRNEYPFLANDDVPTLLYIKALSRAFYSRVRF